jgi:drug/metabolite transporter (DMT)-like permease
VSFLSVVACSLAFAVLLAALGGWGELASYDAGTWGWLLYLGVVTVGLGYLLYFEGMRRVPASRGASLFYLKPVLAVLLAHYALGEPVTYALVLATVMVAAGVLLVTLPRKAPRGRVT